MIKEFIGIFKILLRWLWLIILITGGMVALLYLSTRTDTPVYEAKTTVEITSPDSENINLFDEFISSNDRDNIAIELNKFLVISQYDEVRQRTKEELGIEEDYGFESDSELGADFAFLTVTASSAELARDIANTHTAKAIEYFGELRVLPLGATISYFEEQLATVEEEIATAEEALLEFQLENDIVSVEDELEIQNQVIEALEIAQAQFSFDLATGEEEGSSDVILEELLQDDSENAVVTPEEINELLSSYRQDLSQTALLEPEYNELVSNLSRLRSKQSTLSEKYTEAQLKQNFASQAFFVQIFRDASLPSAPKSSTLVLVFGGVGSLGFSILLAFVLDYIFAYMRKPEE